MILLKLRIFIYLCRELKNQNLITMNESKATQTRYPWLKQLLISIFGTAIGVGLTFFANNAVEKKHQRAAQRETAIMAVCDIEEIIQELKEEIHLEDSLLKVVMYVSSHQEMIDSFSMDTLSMAFKYLYDNPMTVKEWTSNTKENAFNSGIDARINIGNNHFYDNVQSCYYERRSLMKVMADAPVFRRPISKGDYEGFLQKLGQDDLDFNGDPSLEAMREAMKQFMALEATALYLKRYFVRREAYMWVVDKLERLNRENKLLMNISEKDIEEYIKWDSDNVSQQSPADLLLGSWELRMNNYQSTFVFHENNNLEYTTMTSFQGQFKFDEEQKEIFVLCPMTLNMLGKWELKGDTLTIDYNCSKAEMLSFDIDRSSFPQAALDRMKDSLDIKIGMMKDYILESIRQQSRKEVNIVSFDKSGNSMLWKSTDYEEKMSFQLYRKLE